MNHVEELSKTKIVQKRREILFFIKWMILGISSYSNVTYGYICNMLALQLRYKALTWFVATMEETFIISEIRKIQSWSSLVSQTMEPANSNNFIVRCWRISDVRPLRLWFCLVMLNDLSANPKRLNKPPIDDEPIFTSEQIQL